MKSPVMLGFGALAVLLGLVFMLQGIGTLKGSSMTNSNFWAVAGPVIAIIGLVLVVRGVRRGPSSGAP
jgi:hypothetical protein